MAGKYYRLLLLTLILPLLSCCFISCGNSGSNGKGQAILEKLESILQSDAPDEYNPVNALLVLPGNPVPGENFRILATGGSNLKHARIVVSGPSGNLESKSQKYGKELPCWRIDDFKGSPAGKYRASLIVDDKEAAHLEFNISKREITFQKGGVWKTTRSWNPAAETIYSAWINALFQDWRRAGILACTSHCDSE